MASLPPTKQDSYWNLMSMLNYARATRDWIGQHATSDSAMTLATLLDSFQAMAVAYYDEVEAAVQDQETLVQAYELQAALERLARQWMIIAPAIQVSAVVAEPSSALLSLVVEGAAQSLQLNLKERVAIVPHFGLHFELVRFNYAPQVALIGVPITTLQTPWQWSVIWHELAGLLVGQEKIRALIYDFLDTLPEAGRPLWQPWEEAYQLEAEQNLLLRNQPPGNTPTILNVTLSANTSVYSRHGWLEEFIEDACTILTLGPTAYDILVTLFTHRYQNLDQGSDYRHPVPGLRLEVAYQVLRCMASASPAALATVASHRQPHGTVAVDDPTAVFIARWIWEQRVVFVKPNYIFDHWSELKTRNAPLERVEPIVQELMSEDAEHLALDDLAKKVRTLVIDARRAIKNATAGNAIWDHARDDLQSLMGDRPDILAAFTNNQSQAGPFIEQRIKNKSLEDLKRLIMGATDPIITAQVETHDHLGDPQNVVACINVTISGLDHGLQHNAWTWPVYWHVH